MSSRRNVNALSVVTLVFAILAAVVLFFAALYTLVINVADMAVGHFSGTGMLSFDSGIESVFPLILENLTPIFCIGCMLSAAVILIFNRNSSAMFSPFGFLTVMAFLPFFSFVMMLVFGFTTGLPIGNDEYGTVLNMFQSAGSFSVIPLGVIASLVFGFTAKMLGRFRCIAMAVICLICGLGSVAEIAFSVIGVLSNLSVVFDAMALTEGTELFFLIWQNLASPILGCGSLMMVALASFLAIFATLSSD